MEFVLGEAWYSTDGGLTWYRGRGDDGQRRGVALEVVKVDHDAGLVTVRVPSMGGAPELDDERRLHGE